MEIRRSTVLTRVTAVPGAELFSGAEVLPAEVLSPAAVKAAAFPAEPRPRALTPAVASDEPAPRRAGNRHARTGLVTLGMIIGAVIVVVPIVVLSSRGGSGEDPAGSAARPGGGTGGETGGGAGGLTGRDSAGSITAPRPAGSDVPAGRNAANSAASSGPGAGKSGGAGPRTFSLVAGPGCGSGVYDRIGYYSQGKAGWLSGSGGYTGAGCDGRFDALPMSGTTSGDDPGLYARWTFDPGLRHKCQVVVYTPNNGSKVYVGGSPAHYSVHQQNNGAALAGFSIDQPHNLGRWVSGRSFTTNGAFYVRLDNTGKDWSGSTKTYAHVAAAQVRATCS